MRTERAASAAMLLPIALVLLWSLSAWKSLTGDEALTVAIAGSSYHSLLRAVTLDPHMPGFYTVAWLWVRLFGDSLLSIRLLALAPVLAACLTACRKLPARAAALMCLSPFALHLAVEFRMYGALMMFGVFDLVLLRRLAERFGGRAFALLLLSLVAGTWVHYFAWPAVAASAFLLFRAGRRRHAAAAVAVPVALYIPLMPVIIRQVHRFAGAPGDVQAIITSRPSLLQVLVGAPLSLAGTIYRFAAGTASASFNQFSIGAVNGWTIIGFGQLALMGFLFLRGWRRAGAAPILLLLWTMLPLSLIRPSARHFAIAFPAFVTLVSSGFLGTGRLRVPATGLAAVLSVILCVPFVLRPTLPQRCTFDRDMKEAAEEALSLHRDTGLPIVCYLDNYTTLAFLYHLRQANADGSAVIWHPFEEAFASEEFICLTPEDAVGFLMHDTDSLGSVWADSSGGSYILVANDPGKARGPVMGGADRIVGVGSDVMSDQDLTDALSARASLERFELRGSRGPLSIFVVRGEPGRR